MAPMRANGICMHTEDLGPVTVAVFCQEGTYSVFIIGEEVASFLGSSQSLEDCMEEIKCLKGLVESDLFRRALEGLK